MPKASPGHDGDLDRLEEDLGEFRRRVRHSSTEGATEQSRDVRVSSRRRLRVRRSVTPSIALSIDGHGLASTVEGRRASRRRHSGHPFSAAMAARCEMFEMFDVVWLW